jgi:fatty acid desaturase
MSATALSQPATAYDFSADFHRLRSTLRSKDDTPYVQFVAGLRPRYDIVRRDIALGYGALLTSSLLIAWLGGYSWIGWAITVLGAAAIGFWIAYLQLFMHEAAHFNLTRDRKRNDLIANVFVCAIAGQEIARYRRVHFQHHRALGQPDDTEQTYATPLTAGFLLKILSGARSIEVIGARAKHLSRETDHTTRNSFFSPWIVLTLVLHASVLGSAWWFRNYLFAVAWVAGVGIFFPFFGALRNLLEHRPQRTLRETHEAATAVTRVFGDDAFSRTFGGAGFNRHLLHHWEPQVSYTNLPDLEQFLATTPLQEVIEARRTTYWRVFLDLLRWRAA